MSSATGTPRDVDVLVVFPTGDGVHNIVDLHSRLETRCAIMRENLSVETVFDVNAFDLFTHRVYKANPSIVHFEGLSEASDLDIKWPDDFADDEVPLHPELVAARIMHVMRPDYHEISKRWRGCILNLSATSPNSPELVKVLGD